MKKFYLVYQITNLINDKIYIGIHSTDDLDDGYFGSGTYLKRAIKKEGIESFEKKILFKFDNPEEMIAKERELVDRKFIARKDVYNSCLGGGFLTLDTISVKDNEGNCFRVHKDDERWLSGELVGVKSGIVTVQNSEGMAFSVSVNDSRRLSGELVGISIGKVFVKNFHGKITSINSDDCRIKSGELFPVNRGSAIVRDVNNNYFRIDIDDPRYLSGELVGTFFGCKHTDGTKKIISENSKIHQKGEGNSQFGTCWIHNEIESKKIKKTELDSFLSNGWIKGRKMKF